MNVDGQEYVHNGSFLYAGRPDTTIEMLQAFAASIRSYHPGSLTEQYITIDVDGIKCKYWAGDGLPMPLALDMYQDDVRNGRTVVDMVRTNKGYLQPIFYQDALQLYSLQKRTAILKNLQNQEPAASHNTCAMRNKRILAAEKSCKRILVYLIKEQGAKYADLLEAIKKCDSLPQPQWVCGCYNTPEKLAAAAIDEACEVCDTLETEYTTSLRNIADYMQAPYALLLDYFIEHYIKNQESQPKATRFIPYMLWNTRKND